MISELSFQTHRRVTVTSPTTADFVSSPRPTPTLAVFLYTVGIPPPSRWPLARRRYFSDLYRSTTRQFTYTNQMPMYHVLTRESLLEEWDSLHPGEAMPLELQTLFLKFVNAPRMRRTMHAHSQAILPASAPPPQRFRAQRGRQEKAPAGPSNSCTTQIFNSNPKDGIVDECHGAQMDEMDLAFKAIHIQ